MLTKELTKEKTVIEYNAELHKSRYKKDAYIEYNRLEFLAAFKNAVEQKELNETSAKELLKRYTYIRKNSSNKLADYRSLIEINLKIQLSH